MNTQNYILYTSKRIYNIKHCAIFFVENIFASSMSKRSRKKAHRVAIPLRWSVGEVFI